jgi:hypothetical protein
MRQKILLVFIGLWMSVSVWAYSGGNGTATNPYQISSVADMEQLATYVNGGESYAGKYFRLTRDLTGPENVVTTVVGYSKDNNRCFSGIFDGDGHRLEVNILNINDRGEKGVFGRTDGATIKNLGIEGSVGGGDYTGYNSVGGICGYAKNTVISNCYNTGEISATYSSDSSSGGICGYAYDSSISDCYNTGIVSSFSSSYSSPHSSSGGICGYAYISSISNCHNTGIVSSFSYAHPSSGGICGYSSYGNSISNCYNTGDVVSYYHGSYNDDSFSGGICGIAYNGSNISNCYNIGDVSFSDAFSSASYNPSILGGICGQSDAVTTIQNCFVANCQIKNPDLTRTNIGRIGGINGIYVNCYADENVKLHDDPIGSSDVNSRDGKDATLADLQSQSWLMSNLAWDFTGVWYMPVGGGQFPELMPYSDNQEVTISISLPEVRYGDRITLSATSNNTMAPIVYASSDNSVAEINDAQLTSKKAGTVTITASQAAGDGFAAGSTSVTLTIQKKELIITAHSPVITYGNTPPSYTCQYSGFANNETESVLTTLPSFSCSATSQSNVGTYAITPSGAAAQNYNFSYVNGTLTIQKRNLQVTPNDASRAYGSVNPTFTLSYSGFVNDNTASNIGTKPVATTTATSYSNAGTYSITCSGGSATNYNFIYNTGTLTVTKALLTIGASNATRNYGAGNPTFSVTYSGFMNSENETVLSALPQAGCTATSTSNVGTYPINVSGGYATNYDFSYRTGTLTVNKVLLTITAQSAFSVYGDALPVYSYLCGGFVNGENESVLSTRPSLSCNATVQSDAGSYAITPSNAVAQNYTFEYRQGVLTIDKSSLTLTANDATRRQGEDNPVFTLSCFGFKNGETESVLDILPTIRCSAELSSPVGFYDIVLSGGYDNNYDYNLINGRLEVTLPDGIGDVSVPEIAVYPNPVKHDLYIRSEAPIQKLEICYLSGARIAVRENGNKKINISDLPNGTYLVRIYTEAGSVTKNIIKN